ncbi:hypothetical protein [Embleya scabrispora]|uniref:hypothetical protein n=1 Tax=Embleya scabrispora TaxID=159449 RepID=UPI001374C2B7|nr:hypothetical protein [Embleya scabrispora]
MSNTPHAGERLGLDVDPARSTDDPPAAGGGTVGQREHTDARLIDGCFGELSVGESVPLLAVAAVENHPVAVDGHRVGTPYAVRPHPHRPVGVYLDEREVRVRARPGGGARHVQGVAVEEAGDAGAVRRPGEPAGGAPATDSGRVLVEVTDPDVAVLVDEQVFDGVPDGEGRHLAAERVEDSDLVRVLVSAGAGRGNDESAVGQAVQAWPTGSHGAQLGEFDVAARVNGDDQRVEGRQIAGGLRSTFGEQPVGDAEDVDGTGQDVAVVVGSVGR